MNGKIYLWFMLGSALGLVLCILYSALVVASRQDDIEEKRGHEKNLPEDKK